MLRDQSTFPTNLLRDTIINAYRMDETVAITALVDAASLSADQLKSVHENAKRLVIETREYKKKQSKIDVLLHQYDLSTEEGIALMCLAEALLRIPDKATMDKFISDKLSTVHWGNHLDRRNPLFVNAATWSLLLTGKVYAPTLSEEKGLYQSLKRVMSRMGASLIRPMILKMMQAIGQQFVMGETIASALKRASKSEATGYRFSYDMLGEAARTSDDAAHYYQAYLTAIEAIGHAAKHGVPLENPGISIKLSALHPRYELAQYHRVMQEVAPKLLALAVLAKQYNIGLTVDAEEADRLDVSLDLFEQVFADSALADWDGFGLAVQAYQKRAPFVIDWLIDLAKKHQKRIMVRLVKGAYWDAEIKWSQVQGLSNYPVYTRKNATDVAYLACAKKLLSEPTCFYPQFGTHNAYSVAAILEMAGDTPFEFQCLHGMGQSLYNHVVDPKAFNKPCRIYAPVGTHKELLGYLVRRLLENGANSSFVNRLADDQTPIEQMVVDPVARMAGLHSKPHPRIPLPKDIYGQWQNSEGIDLSNLHLLKTLKARMEVEASHLWRAAPIVDGKLHLQGTKTSVRSPSDHDRVIGEVYAGDSALVNEALCVASHAVSAWGGVPVDARADIFERAANLLQEAMPEFAAVLTREAGKCIPDCLSEIRETIDYCRYYAYRARLDLSADVLPGPTGESNVLTYHPRGVMVCISPWNFPLAIFSGQLIAALVAGNAVIAKPAEQTALVAFKMVQLLHEAGVPTGALQLMLGRGSVIGAQLVADERIAGVIFTGSTEVAKRIEQTLANRSGPLGVLIAETGGQNAMIVDSSALPEQVVADVVQSAFNSAGQRCSALRVLFVQEEIAPRLLAMLKGCMQELTVGEPSMLATDIGPVIDINAREMLVAHAALMQQQGKLIAEIPVSSELNGSFFAPCAFEIPELGILRGEVFGPILHVIRYKESELDRVIESIIKTGYGLTFGIHSRIEAVIRYVIEKMPIGNLYVNRNMIGAVVGVQPFGGEGLSGTGPKAGGPNYLKRLCVERVVSINTVAVGGNARLVSLIEDDE